ncbi:MAG: insulinase family protein [Candidatus Cloacimonetes bacterium]|nr:insulinase family protein [Candidatus Cloacimonadota bacterium]
MKKLCLVIISLGVACLLSAGDMLFETLDNGMQVIISRNTANNSAAVYGFVQTGSNTEEQFLGAGISHYLEHLVSSGTTTLHTESEYSELMEKYSLVSNAYTNTDMTAYYLMGEAAYTDTMISTVAEFLRHCVFAQEEVDREKEVILKEMVMRSTNPYSQVYQWENAQFYPLTNSKYPIIGYPELYKQITRDNLLAYYHQHYIPNNIIFVVVGNFDPQQVMQKVKDTFNDWKRSVYQPVFNPTQGVYGGEYNFSSEFPLNNAKVSINYILSEYSYRLAPELSAALDLLFSKRQSVINYRLVEKEKLVNYIYAYAPPVPSQRGDNAARIVFEPKRVEDIELIIGIIDEELAKAVKTGFKQDMLANFLNREKAARILKENQADDEANQLAWSLYSYGIPDAEEVELKALESIDINLMPQAINEILLPQLRTITRALPETEVKQNEELAVEAEYNLSMKKIAVDNNVTLLYRYDDRPDVVFFNINLPVHQDWETMDNAGILEMTTDLLFEGSKRYDTLEITEWLEDHVINFRSNISDDGLSISIKCLSADIDKTLDIFCDGFNHPSFSESEIELWKTRKQAGFERQSTTARYQHTIFRNGVLYPKSRQGMITEDVVKKQLAYSRDDIMAAWETYFKAENLLIAINGDIMEERALNIARDLEKRLRKGKVDATRNYLKVPDINSWFSQEYNFEQVNININTAAPKVTDPDFKVMTLIKALMNRTDGGLHEATRGVNDLAYFASADYSVNQNSAFFRITSQTSLENRDELIAVLAEEIEKMKTIEISSEDIQQVLLNNKIIRRNYLSPSYIGRVSIDNEVNGRGYDWLEKEMDELSGVTAADIRRVAEKYFTNITVIVSYPSEDFKRSIQ